MTATLVEPDVRRENDPVGLATVRAFERGEIRLYSTTPQAVRPPTMWVHCPGECPTRSIFLVASVAEFDRVLADHLDEVDHTPERNP